MEQSSSEKQLRIRKQFDSFCKTLLKNEMIDYERARSYQQKHEVSFSELTQEELSRLNTEDDYIAESEVFRVLDYDIEVKDELISEALKYLPEKKRNVILLSFFSGYDRYGDCKAHEPCQKYHSSSPCKLTPSIKKDYGGNQEWRNQVNVQSCCLTISLRQQLPAMWKQSIRF